MAILIAWRRHWPGRSSLAPDRPHDTLFRYAFERPEIAESELRALLPPAVVEALDFSALSAGGARSRARPSAGL